MPDKPKVKRKTCAGCGSRRIPSAFPADGRTTDGLAASCWSCQSKDYEDAELVTVDLEGVEIFSEGGPYFGTGSPPEGDHFTAERIDAIVAANQALAHEVDPMNKIGHSKEQALALNSGLLITEGERPALGWLTNFRATTRDGLRKIVCDVKGVPRKFAQLIKAGAYPKRSVELSTVESQTLGRTFDRVVTGLAWLGAKAPAVRTLDDVHALFAEGDVVWSPDEGMEAIRQAVNAALNPTPPGAEESESRYWVMDVATDKALISDWQSQANYVADITREDGKIGVAPASEWKLARQAWVESAVAFAEERAEQTAIFEERIKTSGPSADTSETMEFTDEQIAHFAEGFGLSDDDPAKLRELVLAKFDEVKEGGDEVEETEPAPSPTPAPAPTPTPDTPTPDTAMAEEIASLQERAAKGEQAFEAMRVRERATVLDQAIRDGKIVPADRAFWSDRYDRDGTGTVEILERMPSNEEWARVYGRDDDGMAPETQQAAEDAYYEEYARRTGIELKGAASVGS